MLDVPRPSPSAPVRCRQIADADLDAVAALLTRGFSYRGTDYWRRGFARHVARSPPPGFPLYGYMLESGGRPVGVLLTLHYVAEEGGRASPRCNLSSWYVEPDFRAQALMLDKAAQRRKDVTYVNVSPAPHTLALQEARGFERYGTGQFVAAPALSPVPGGVSARLAEAADPLDDLPEFERRLVRDHRDYGCVPVVVSDRGGRQPVVVVQRRIGSFGRGPGTALVPCFQLVYCRDIEAVPHWAGAVGRRLLRASGIPLLVIDAAGPLPGLVGRFFHGRAPKLRRGPDKVRLGDFAYTELVIFGP